MKHTFGLYRNGGWGIEESRNFRAQLFVSNVKISAIQWKEAQMIIMKCTVTFWCVRGVFLFVAYSIENNLHRFEHNMLYK